VTYAARLEMSKLVGFSSCFVSFDQVIKIRTWGFQHSFKNGPKMLEKCLKNA
jgi:hypothetical protein